MNEWMNDWIRMYKRMDDGWLFKDNEWINERMFWSMNNQFNWSMNKEFDWSMNDQWIINLIDQ